MLNIKNSNDCKTVSGIQHLITTVKTILRVAVTYGKSPKLNTAGNPIKFTI